MAHITIFDCDGVRAGVELSEGNIVGTDRDCDVHVVGEGVAPRHCRIFRSDAGWVVEKLDAVSGMCVGGQETSRRLLQDGQGIILGKVRITFFTRQPLPVPPPMFARGGDISSSTVEGTSKIVESSTVSATNHTPPAGAGAVPTPSGGLPSKPDLWARATRPEPIKQATSKEPKNLKKTISKAPTTPGPLIETESRFGALLRGKALVVGAVAGTVMLLLLLEILSLSGKLDSKPTVPSGQPMAVGQFAGD